MGIMDAAVPIPVTVKRRSDSDGGLAQQQFTAAPGAAVAVEGA